MTRSSEDLAAELGPDVIRWRSVGPSRGGRVVAVAGDPSDRSRFWMGACSGGVWMTDDAGQYWKPMSDGFLESASVGAIAVADADPQVVWVGTGESFARNNVVPGDGVYRTVDGGRTWQHRGLDATKHIAKVRVDPRDADVAFVAALGDVFGPSAERGVYRTRDGGDTWDLVLHVSDRAGAADLVLDPANPRVVYASIWQMVRHPWDIVSGGEDSGLWRSRDGGDTWELISDHPGFATGLLGRIGIAASPARPGRVWALVEAIGGQGGVYRSDDAGQTWAHVSTERSVQGRPWYYSHIIAHPTEADTVWCMNTWAWRSRDGGRTFQQVQTPHGDNHDLWIDPSDPQRMINGNDGGACVSVNGGMTWSSIYNQPTAQFYRFDVDHRFPFDLYATQQDNSGIRAPSRSWKGALRWPDCLELGEAEAGDVALDRSDPRFVMLGGAGFGHPGPLLRFDQVTEQARDVAVWPEYFMGIGASEMKHRFGWTYPIEFSPHEPGVLYVGGERVFRSPDGGITWQSISGDLTRDDPAKQQPTGGPISGDSTGAEVYCTIHAFAESPLTPGELWVGTDDGRVHLSRDGGGEWTELFPAGLPEWATVTRIEPSHHQVGRAYLTAHAYRLQDLRPLVYRTDDFGATWEAITAGIPETEWARSIREDPLQPHLLFVATERRVWFSVDRGAPGRACAGTCPPCPSTTSRCATTNSSPARTGGRSGSSTISHRCARSPKWHPTVSTCSPRPRSTATPHRTASTCPAKAPGWAASRGFPWAARPSPVVTCRTAVPRRCGSTEGRTPRTAPRSCTACPPRSRPSRSPSPTPRGGRCAPSAPLCRTIGSCRPPRCPPPTPERTPSCGICAWNRPSPRRVRTGDAGWSIPGPAWHPGVTPSPSPPMAKAARRTSWCIATPAEWPTTTICVSNTCCSCASATCCSASRRASARPLPCMTCSPDSPVAWAIIRSRRASARSPTRLTRCAESSPTPT
ncbi:hypothetical protein QSU92_03965 [Microbacterium sp. ET2]|uniref:WD40/YVTN/BNR-like repeat-containing protein n=1 Tax=Microbacterium albipurpureum TaxID=3050384 RepID=UPI00259CC6DE|nr:hypothetical protein [Microbacterium sp. ET2 (Ac-2212)]WJL96352.1 hypothetical protein QSU92_03965 [Microbacterium sp. ET2 (Ac-2212)]